MAKKEKTISQLVLQQKWLRERFAQYQNLQELNRKQLKHYRDCNENKPWIKNYIRLFEQEVFEQKVVLNALQKQCLGIKKKIKMLNKEQNKQNNKENGK